MEADKMVFGRAATSRKVLGGFEVGRRRGSFCQDL